MTEYNINHRYWHKNNQEISILLETPWRQCASWFFIWRIIGMGEKRILDYNLFETIEYSIEKNSLHVTASELSPFIDKERELAKKIGARKIKYTKEHGYSTEKANDQLEEDCLIPADTMRKTILGTTKCTRNFLYKFTVGMRMTVDEAKEFFSLCDGPLYERCMADYICKKALEDGDDIHVFVEDFEKNTGIKLVKKTRTV